MAENTAASNAPAADSRPCVLVTVVGGIATIHADTDAVRVALIDYDNDPDALTPEDFLQLRALDDNDLEPID